MTLAALAAILFGAVLIISRAPFAVAPAATRDFYLKLMSTTARIRLLALPTGGLGVLMVMAGRDAPFFESVLLVIPGGLLVLTMIFPLLLFASWFKSLFQSVLSALDPDLLRLMGLVFILIGGLYVALGVSLWR